MKPIVKCSTCGASYRQHADGCVRCQMNASSAAAVARRKKHFDEQAAASRGTSIEELWGTLGKAPPGARKRRKK